jgi:predicted nucleotidyltransferase
MDKTTVTAIITFLKTELLQKGVKLNGIALFGSQLTGLSNPESDLDLIIVSDSFQNKNIFERSEITMDTEIKALKKFHIPMDILKMTDKEFDQSIKNKRFEAQLIN